YQKWEHELLLRLSINIWFGQFFLLWFRVVGGRCASCFFSRCPLRVTPQPIGLHLTYPAARNRRGCCCGILDDRRCLCPARDGIAVIVNTHNPVSDLTLDQVKAIFTGATSNWKALGGPDKPITVITREEGSGTRGAFEELVLKGGRIGASALVQDSTGAVREMVHSDPSAIGYISLGQVNDQVKALKLAGV